MFHLSFTHMNNVSASIAYKTGRIWTGRIRNEMLKSALVIKFRFIRSMVNNLLKLARDFAATEQVE